MKYVLTADPEEVDRRFGGCREDTDGSVYQSQTSRPDNSSMVGAAIRRTCQTINR